MLAQTANYGRTWTTVPTPGINWGQGYDRVHPGVDGVRFADARHGYLFGSFLWSTEDGGRRWTKASSPGFILDVQVDAGATYALIADCPDLNNCSTQERLYKVGDGGRSLTPFGPSAAFGAAQLVVKGGTVYLMVAAHQRDSAAPATLWVWNGVMWTARNTPCTWNGADASALAAWSATGLALVCGSEPGAGNQLKSAYRSVDGGRHWTSRGQLPGSGGYVASLAAATADTWVLGEGRGTIVRTTDGGHTWTSTQFSPESNVGNTDGWGYVGFTTAIEGVAVPWTLNGSALAFTHDSGRRWAVVSFPGGR